MDQVVIKALLIVAFAVFGVILLRPGRSARNQAIRTLGLACFLVVAIIAVIFPTLINDLAVLVGVGRGTDLLLYAFLVVFIGNALSTTRKRKVHDAQITEIARQLALSNPIVRESTD